MVKTPNSLHPYLESPNWLVFEMKVSSSAKNNLLALVKMCSNNISLHDINHNNTSSTASLNEKATGLKSSEGVLCNVNACSTPRKHEDTFSSSFKLSPSSSQENDSVFYSVEYHEEMQSTIGLVRDYVVCRLKRSGFTSRVFVTNIPPSKDNALLHPIMMAGHTFETLQPNLFCNLSRKIGYVFDSEQTVRRLYFRLATHIMGVGKRNFTWGRILALFCLAGAVAVDCVSQGHSNLVEDTIRITFDFIKQSVLEWVVNNGGWKAMAAHFTKSQKSSTKYWYHFTLRDSTLSAVTFGLFAISVLTFLGIEILLYVS